MKRSAAPTLLDAAEISRHYHARPYATLVVEGRYEEAGDQGRYEVVAGDILIHPAFSAHRDLVRNSRTYVLDVPLPFDGRAWPGLARFTDADTLIRAAYDDVREAQAMLVAGLIAVQSERKDPADQLADALSENPSLVIGHWAAANGYSREWLSRRFKRLYGVDAALFRVEARSRRAWARIVSSDEPLAQVAIECGFADQPHMTRSINRLTSCSPRSWRQSSPVTSVQERYQGRG